MTDCSRRLNKWPAPFGFGNRVNLSPEEASERTQVRIALEELVMAIVVLIEASGGNPLISIGAVYRLESQSREAVKVTSASDQAWSNCAFAAVASSALPCIASLCHRPNSDHPLRG